MDDILGQGGDREPSPWPRRLAVLAAVIVVAGAGVFYLSRPHQRSASVAAPATPASASPAPSEPSGIVGHTLPWAASLRLPITGTQPVWFSPASGQSEPIAPRASRTFTGVIAASPTEIAWTSGCAPTCRIQVLDLATGRQTAVALPAASSVDSAAFSPSEGFLALQVSSDSTGDDGGLAMQLDVASVVSGRLTAVPGTFVSSDALVGFGWPTSGDSLVAEFIFTTKAQLASWHPGATSPAVTVIRPGNTQASLILG